MATAAAVEDNTSEIDDVRDYGRQHQETQEFSNASERLTPSEVDHELHPTMPDADQQDDNYDRGMYEAPSGTGRYAQDTGDVQDQVHYDDERYHLQEPFPQDAQYRDQGSPVPHQTAHYYDGHFQDDPMPPDVMQPFAADQSRRTHAVSEFQRIAGQDHRGFDEPFQYAPGRSHPPTRQNWSYIRPQQLKQLKSTKKSTRKPKKPPRSRAQGIATHNTNSPAVETSYPTPANGHRVARRARFQPDQDQQGGHEQRQHDWAIQHPDVVDERARNNQTEQQIDREMQSAAVVDGHRPFSAVPRDRSVRQNDTLPVSPPPTRAAVDFHSAPRPVDPPSVLRHSTASNSVINQRFDSRSAPQQPVAPQKAPRPNALSTYGGATTSSDPIDGEEEVSRILSKMSRDKNKKEAQYRAEYEVLQRQLVQAAHEKQVAENQCYTLQQEQQGLRAEVQKCIGRVADYQKLKTHVDGLGRDYDLLRRQANAGQVKIDQLIEEDRQRQDLQESLSQDSKDRVEESTQLRMQAMEWCREARSELSSTAAKHSQLQQKLNLKDELLTAEKNLRLHLQAQLKAVGHDSEAVVRLLKSNNDALLETLDKMVGMLEDSNSKQEVTESLEKVNAAIQNLGSRSTAKMEDFAAVKALVESLAEDIAKPANHTSEAVDQTTAFKACFEEGLHSLKADLSNREQLAAEASTYRETIAGLTEKLKMSDERASEHKKRMSESHARENETNKANVSLQAKIAELENAQIANAASASNIHKVEASLHAKASALDAMRAELDAKREDLASLQAINESLKDEVKSLQQQLAEVSAASTDMSAQRAEWEKKLADAVEQTRVDMTQQIDEFNEQQISALRNENKRLSREGDKHKDAEKRLRDARSELENAQRESSTTERDLEEKLTAANERARFEASKVEALENTVNALQNSANSNAGKAKELQEAKFQLQKEKSDVQRLESQVKKLDKQSKEEKANASNSASESQLAQRKVEKSHKEAESAREQLAEAQKQIAEHEDGMKRFRASSEEALEKAREAASKKEAALHDQLQDVKSELEGLHRKHEAFHAQVEDSWKEERIKQEETLASANDQVLQAEAERDNAQAAAAALREQLYQLSHVPAEQGNSHARTHTPGVKKGQETINAAEPVRQGASRVQVPKKSKDITPDAASDFVQPTRPRKRVDRDSQSVEEISAIPAPEVLRPSSARPNTGEIVSVARGLVVEESQQGLMGPSGMPISSPPSGHLNPFEVDRSAPVPKSPVLSHPRYREFVPETHYNDAVPSFATSHAKRSSTQRKVPLNDIAASQYQTAPDFQIYEDANEPVCTDTQDAAQYPQDSLPAAKDPYLFEKAKPPPNSSSKLVREPSEVSPPSRGFQGLAPSLKKADRSNSSHSNLSSSPGFVTSSKPSRATITYRTSPDKKRGTARRQSDLGKEAAAEMAAPPKRKSESSVVSGYEEERRKRVKPTNAAPNTSRAGLRSMAQPAGAENPRASIMSELSIPRSSSLAGSQTSRMQTLAGRPTSQPRRTKKRSQQDQMNAKFAQELSMGRG